MEVWEYEIKYPNLDIETLIKNKQLFEYEVIAAYAKEYEKGFKVKNIGKTHRTGTKFTYIKIDAEEDLKQYDSFLGEMIEGYNKKYDTKIAINEFIQQIYI